MLQQRDEKKINNEKYTHIHTRTESSTLYRKTRGRGGNIIIIIINK